MAPDGKAPNKPWWVGSAVAVFGGFYLASALRLPLTEPNAGIGAGAVPSTIGAALVLVGLGLVMEAIRGRPFAPQEAEDVAADRPASGRALLLAAVAALLPLLTMGWFGFVITGAACFAIVAAAFGSRRPLLDGLIGLGLSFACWFGFGTLGIDLGGLLPLLGI